MCTVFASQHYNSTQLSTIFCIAELPKVNLFSKIDIMLTYFIIIINIQSALGNTVSISSRYSSNVAAITWYYRYRL